MKFLVLTVIYCLLHIRYRRYWYYPKIDGIVRPHFGPNMPSMLELAKSTSLVMVNSHPAIDYVESLPPNVIEVAGLQIKEPQLLNEELINWMNSGQKGAIFFSMGTNMQSSDMTLDRIEVIVKAFAALEEYNILWKFDIEYLKDIQLPKNVLIKPFLPQRDILGWFQYILMIFYAILIYF